MDKVKQYKVLPLITALYITTSLLTIVLLYKIVSFHNIPISAATLIIPVWYALSDLIAEVYGYHVARKLIWIMFACNFIFIFTIYGAIHLPSGEFMENADAYQSLYNDLPRIFLGSFVAVLVGVFVNVYCIVRWKVLLHGRLFWIRSIGSSAIGSLIFTIIAFLIEFLGRMSLIHIVKMIVVSYAVKIVFLPIAAAPCAMVASWLKRYEGIDAYDQGVNFNPFALGEQ